MQNKKKEQESKREHNAKLEEIRDMRYRLHRRLYVVALITVVLWAVMLFVGVGGFQ